MSGGSIGDYGYYRLNEWACDVERENPVLAELLRDLEKVLHDYDWYISGDTGKESAEASWQAFREKWLDGADMEPLVRRIMQDTADSIVRGWRRRDGRCS